MTTAVMDDTHSEPVAIERGLSRWYAFGIHLAISGVIFVGLAYLVLYQWYPGFFFETDGGWEGMRILIGVDLVLGPLLTLIVFRAGKPGLRNDLIMIGIFQAVCLAGGIYVVHSERPIALVYVDGQFNSVTLSSYDDDDITPPDWGTFTGDYPKRVQVSIPEDPTLQTDLRRSMLQGKRQMNLAVEYYESFDKDNATFLADAFDYAALKDRDQELNDIPRFLAEHGGELEDYRFYPLATRYQYFFLGFHSDDNRLAGLLRTPGPL